MTDTAPLARPLLGRALSAFGAAIVAVLLLVRTPASVPWVPLGVAAAVLWFVAVLLPPRTPRPVVLAVLGATVLLAAPTGPATDVTGLVPALVAMLAVIAMPERPAALATALPIAAAVLVAAGTPLSGRGPSILLACLGAIVLAVVVGTSRRQARTTELQSRRLLEQQVAVEQERARSAALAERSRIARDLHDVLAHSLGGLVLQLDAVDALLDAGRTTDAAARVRSARALAADGLDEARRAVDALREPEEAADLTGALRELLEVHRALGATATLVVEGEPAVLPPERAGALRRATQEVLTNARRHAPGRPTSLVLRFGTDAVELHATTPALAEPVAASGSGRGLAGLRNRIRDAGGDASWGVSPDGFAVDARVPR